MKGNRAKTNLERQAEYRGNLALNGGKRLSVTISPEALAALQVIQNGLAGEKMAHTKKAAIETALFDLAGRYRG